MKLLIEQRGLTMDLSRYCGRNLTRSYLLQPFSHG